jgi:hypothetical protein
MLDMRYMRYDRAPLASFANLPIHPSCDVSAAFVYPSVSSQFPYSFESSETLHSMNSAKSQTHPPPSASSSSSSPPSAGSSPSKTLVFDDTSIIEPFTMADMNDIQVGRNVLIITCLCLLNDDFRCNSLAAASVVLISYPYCVVSNIDFTFAFDFGNAIFHLRIHP